MNPKAAIAFCIAGIVISFLVLSLLLDTTPTTHTFPPNGNRVAAVAIRDNVIPFQKFGSKLFTLPAIKKAYDGHFYVTDLGNGAARGEFKSALQRAARDHDSIDLFILAHSNRIVEWVSTMPPNVRQKIRMVYNTGCGDAYQYDAWKEVGVRTYVGHPGKASVSPVFYVFFMRRWIRGHTAYDAAKVANRKMRAPITLFGGPASNYHYNGSALADMTTATVEGDLQVTIR